MLFSFFLSRSTIYRNARCWKSVLAQVVVRLVFFAGDLVDVYRKYISSQGWSSKVIDSSNGEDGGYKNVVLEVKGDSVYSRMKWEAGVHRVQRVPATESQGTRPHIHSDCGSHAGM